MSEIQIQEPVLALVGPTAIGKTSLSLKLAKQFNCEIVSIDSMQVYKYMDIGTAKVTPEEMEGIEHHLIDIVTPDEPYDASQYRDDALDCIQKIHAKGKLPLLTGGTGLYLRALVSGIFQGGPTNQKIRETLQAKLEKVGAKALHEELYVCDCISAKRIHVNDTYRVLRALEIFYSSGKTWSSHIATQDRQNSSQNLTNILQIGLTCDRKVLYERINLRTTIMLQNGLEKETHDLLNRGYGRHLKSMTAIGYRHMLNYIYSDWSFDEMERLLARDTRRYAKRQYTWFSKLEQLEWYEVTDERKIVSAVSRWLETT